MQTLMIVWLIDNCIHALLKIPIHLTLKTANYHSVLEMLRSWTCLHYNDNNCPEGLQNKYKIIEFDLTPWNLSFSQYVIFWQGVWLLISLQVSLGSFKLWFEIPRYFNSFIIICTRADAIASDSWIYLIPDQLSGTFSNTCKKVTGDYYSQNTFRDVTMTG